MEADEDEELPSLHDVARRTTPAETVAKVEPDSVGRSRSSGSLRTEVFRIEMAGKVTQEKAMRRRERLGHRVRWCYESIHSQISRVEQWDYRPLGRYSTSKSDDTDRESHSG